MNWMQSFIRLGRVSVVRHVLKSTCVCGEAGLLKDSLCRYWLLLVWWIGSGLGRMPLVLVY